MTSDAGPIAALDLNLLRVFDAMMRERNTLRTGERVGLSQPAVSAALGRLRHFTGDALFVRVGNRMVPTPRAEALAAPVRAALSGLENALAEGAPFDPATAQRRFMLAGSDYFSALLMPELARRVLPQAPGLTLQMIDCLSEDMPSFLADGRADLVLDRALDAPDWVDRRRLFRSELVCVLQHGHPAVRGADIVPGGTMPPAIFAAVPQVLRSADGSKTGTIDAALARAGLSRRVAMTVPHFQAVALVVASSGLMGSLPIHFARHVARHLPITLYRLPFPSPQMDIFMYWHRRVDGDGASLWLRERLADLAETAFGADAPI